MLRANDDKCTFGSRRIYILVLIGQTMGLSSSLVQTNIAVMSGAAGYMVGYVLAYLLVGIPTLYMELVVSQYTARDCLAVWTVRPCLSHVGYVLIFWQAITLIYNHVILAFIVDYLLVSFEFPIPYHVCGSWASKDCKILHLNYTVNQDCIRTKDPMSYCDNLYTTFPEVQYFRYNVLGGNSKATLHIARRACLASGIVCIIIFMNCFKRMNSVKWFIGIFTIFPFFGYLTMMLGSMVQKGLVAKYEEALDFGFDTFLRKVRVSNIIQQVLYSLSVGSGVLGNLSSAAAFRAPSRAAALAAGAADAAFCALAVGTTALLSCAYAHEHGVSTAVITTAPMSLVFEKLPRLLYEFTNRNFWIILMFTSQVCIGLSTDVILFYSLTEMVAKRYEKIARYPGLMSAVGVVILFVITVPLLGPFGINLMVGAYRRYIYLTSTFVVIVECFVFIVWYGFGRFSEDVHFMQGVKPTRYMKAGWILSSVVLPYVLFSEIQRLWKFNTFVDIIGFYTFISITVAIVVVTLARLLVAAFQKRFLEMILLDPGWGPESELLRRSRAMFSAQAMTKEYMYRQYHLQAGILARQKKSNAREEPQRPDRRATCAIPS